EDWVLCRVFHKSKAEDHNTKFNPEFMFETKSNNGTMNLAASPLTDQQTQPCGYQQMTSLSSTPTHQNQDQQSSLLNLLQLSQDRNANPNITSTDISSKAVDDYAFLWDDMNLEETSLGDGVVASNLEDMRFEIDHNSMLSRDDTCSHDDLQPPISPFPQDSAPKYEFSNKLRSQSSLNSVCIEPVKFVMRGLAKCMDFLQEISKEVEKFCMGVFKLPCDVRGERVLAFQQIHILARRSWTVKASRFLWDTELRIGGEVCQATEAIKLKTSN
ncbi:unnamed protein product, partial [Dovyalis caffra]